VILGPSAGREGRRIIRYAGNNFNRGGNNGLVRHGNMTSVNRHVKDIRVYAQARRWDGLMARNSQVTM